MSSEKNRPPTEYFNGRTHAVGLVFRENPDDPDDPLIRLIYQEWNQEHMYPKGGYETGKDDRHTLDTAAREVEEESGLERSSLRLLSAEPETVEWTSSWDYRHKVADVWSFTCEGDDDPDPMAGEAGESLWVSFSERYNYLSIELPSALAIEESAWRARTAYLRSKGQPDLTGFVEYAQQLASRILHEA